MCEVPETSIIIRTKNESRWLSETLERLKAQSYQNFEIIVVDSGSTDNTLEICTRFNVKVVNIASEKFTYPYAINFGIKYAAAKKYYVILSAHSLPIGENWLANGIDTLASDPMACGLYGPVRAMPNGSLTDKLIHNTSFIIEKLILRGAPHRIIKTYEPGALGFTNAIIRKDLYCLEPINNDYAGGGEDTVWLQYWLNKGYHAIKQLSFSVHHSHYLGPIGWYKQWQHWKSNSTPQKFVHLTYRKDGAHKQF